MTTTENDWQKPRKVRLARLDEIARRRVEMEGQHRRRRTELDALERSVRRDVQEAGRRAATRVKIILGSALVGLDPGERAGLLGLLVPRLAERDLAFMREEAPALLGEDALPPAPASASDGASR